jgi:hypothetical protein
MQRILNLSSKTVVVFSCAHADPSTSNVRFKALGQFLYNLKPDMVFDLGDGADMRSLNSYDERYPKALATQSYERDIESYNNAQELIRQPFKQNHKKQPYWVGFEGNHEHRIKRYLALNPRSEGEKYGVSFSHLQTDYWFDDYHEYENDGPAIATYDGVAYAHYFTTGNSATATSGIHHAYTLVQNLSCSATCGHSHKRDLSFKDGALPNGNIGLVVGCYKGSEEHWAGQANKGWWNGVVIKRELENGMYEPEFVSLRQILRLYG